MDLHKIYNTTDKPIEFTEENLLSVWGEVYQTKNSFSYFESKSLFYDTFYSIIRDTDEELPFFSGGWKISVSGLLIKSAITSALLSSALYFIGEGNLPLHIIPMIIPALFDISRIKLTKGEEYLLGEIYVKEKLRDKFWDVERLYKKLPKKIVEQLSRKDFFDFLDTLVSVGVAKKNKKSQIAIINSKPKFKLNYY
jgi:hypothetical protein